MPTLLVSYAGVLGGAERLLVDFGEAIEGEVHVACPEGSLAERARDAGLEVRPLTARALESRASLRARVPSGRRPDRALARDRHSGGGAPSAHRRRVEHALGDRVRRRAPTGGPEPGVRLPAQRPPPPRPSRARAAPRRAASDRVICLSYAIARDLDPRGTLGDRLRVVHPGVDLAAFAPAGPPAGGAEVLMLGAIVDWKRPRLALDAVACAAGGNLPDVRLTLAGEPLDAAGRTLVSDLEARARRLGIADRVTFAGRVEDPPAALARSSCLVHCADREPFGLALVEALASGRPSWPRGRPARSRSSTGRPASLRAGSVRAAARGLADVLSTRARTIELGAGARRRASSISTARPRASATGGRSRTGTAASGGARRDQRPGGRAAPDRRRGAPGARDGAAPSPAQPGPLPGREAAPGARVPPRPCLGAGRASLPRAGRRVVYSPANLAPLAGRRNVVVIHDVAALRHPEWYRPAYVAYQRRMLPVIARRALRVITVSEFSRGELVEALGTPPERIAVIPDGVGERFLAGAIPLQSGSGTGSTARTCSRSAR